MGADQDTQEGGSGRSDGGCGFDRRLWEDRLWTEAVRGGGSGGGVDRRSYDGQAVKLVVWKE